MASMSRRNQKAFAALIIGACIVASIYDSFLLSSPNDEVVELEFPDEPLLPLGDEFRHHRSLLQVGPSSPTTNVEGAVAGDGMDVSIYPWAQSNLRALSRAPDHERETVLFWHIPKVSY